jgi:DNA polymerase beta
MDHKQRIIELLDVMKKRDFAKNDKWKVRAYDKVIRQLKNKEGQILTMDDLQDIEGIGEKIKQKIQEIIETGDLQQTKNINEEIAVITDLTRVFGIGPIRAKELYVEHGIKNVDDLVQNQNILNEKQKLGLKYYKDFEKRISRKEMVKHDAFIKNTISKIDPNINVEIMGSYRRGANTSGDIDVLLTHEDDPEDFNKIFDSVVLNMKKEKYLVDDFAKGTKKYNGVCRLKQHRTYRRIDIMYTRNKQFPFALLYFTGSQDFNIKLRSWALEKGYTLNEYGLKHIDGELKGQEAKGDFKREEDVMNFLGLKYISPDKRENVELKDFVIG